MTPGDTDKGGDPYNSARGALCKNTGVPTPRNVCTCEYCVGRRALREVLNNLDLPAEAKRAGMEAYEKGVSRLDNKSKN